MTLASQNGEWFLLDELFMQMGLMNNLVDVGDCLGLFSDVDSDFHRAQNLIQKLHKNVVDQFQHFNSNFFGIILQEGMKCFQREDPFGKISLILLKYR